MDIKEEVKRKAVHFVGLLYIPAMLIFGKILLLKIVLALTSLAFILEILRLKEKINIKLIRNYEKKSFASYLHTGIAFSIITAIASEKACLVAASCAFGGDGISGILKGINRRLANVSFILLSSSLSLILNAKAIPAIISAILSSLADGRRYEDNFTIPLIAAFAYLITSKYI